MENILFIYFLFVVRIYAALIKTNEVLFSLETRQETIVAIKETISTESIINSFLE